MTFRGPALRFVKRMFHECYDSDGRRESQRPEAEIVTRGDCSVSFSGHGLSDLRRAFADVVDSRRKFPRPACGRRSASSVSMKAVVFNDLIKIRGINPFVLVAAVHANALKPGWRKSLPVLLRINSEPAAPLRTNMMPVGDGSFYLYLNGVARIAAGVSVGDRVRVEIALDSTYRNGPQHPMPAWFRQALRKNPEAQKNWTALMPSRKKEILRYFAGLKSSEARARNVAKAIRVLSGQTGRFMARTWTNGS